MELTAFLAEMAVKQRLTLHYEDGQIEARHHNKPVGVLKYIIGFFEVVHHSLRTTEVSSQEKTIFITSLNVDESRRGEGIGTLLLFCAHVVGLNHKCTYAMLEDVSARKKAMRQNIYASLGYTHKYSIVEDGRVVENELSDKQLKLPPEHEMLRIMRKKYEGGKTVRNKITVYSMPNKRTRSKKPRRKTRKGGDYGIRSMKTWQNNFDNCLEYPNTTEESCKNDINQWDYHGKSIFGTRPPRESWGPISKKSASRMFKPSPNNFGNYVIIPGMVKTSNGTIEIK